MITHINHLSSPRISYIIIRRLRRPRLYVHLLTYRTGRALLALVCYLLLRHWGGAKCKLKCLLFNVRYFGYILLLFYYHHIRPILFKASFGLPMVERIRAVKPHASPLNLVICAIENKKIQISSSNKGQDRPPDVN